MVWKRDCELHTTSLLESSDLTTCLLIFTLHCLGNMPSTDLTTFTWPQSSELLWRSNRYLTEVVSGMPQEATASQFAPTIRAIKVW